MLINAKTLQEREAIYEEWRNSIKKARSTELQEKQLAALAASDYVNQWNQYTPEQRRTMAFQSAKQADINIPAGVIDKLVVQYPNDWPAVLATMGVLGKINEAMPTWLNTKLANDPTITVEEMVRQAKEASYITDGDLAKI